MWINEGGATFCEEIATEALYGKSAATDFYQNKLSTVLRTAHKDDAGWRSLSGMSRYYTYGTTTYQQGAMVWHSLRGLMGDTLFYACMNRLFRNCAFGNLDAASLRDSLSLYSGMDLTDFFDFHVFRPGFVDTPLRISPPMPAAPPSPSANCYAAPIRWPVAIVCPSLSLVVTYRRATA